MRETVARRAVAPLLAVWLFQLAAFFTPSATWSPMSRFALTHAAASGEGLSLGAWAEATGDRARVGDRWYSDKAPLPALLAVVPYTIVRGIHRATGRPEPAFQAESRGDVPATRVQLNTSAQQLLYASSIGVSGLAFAALALALHALLRRRADARASLVATTLVCLGTPLYAYATSFYGHVPAAALLTVALDAIDPRAPQRRLGLAGLCLGAAVGCEYLAAVPGLVLAIFAVVHGPRPELGARVGRLVAGGLAPVLCLALYHQLCFGAPWLTGYSHLANPQFVSGHQRGLLGIGLPSLEAIFGLLVSTRRGLFVVAPISLVAMVGLALTIPRARGGAPEVTVSEDPLPRLAAIAFVSLFLANAGYYMWWGGAAIGPRHLVPVLPVLAFGVVEVWRRPRARPLVLAAGLASVAIVLALTAVGLEAPEHGNLLVDYALARLRRGEVSALPSATNLGLLLGLPPLASLVPWVVWLVLVGRVLWLRSAP